MSENETIAAPEAPNQKLPNTPRIYVASLADYNAGRLLGKWIDASQSVDDIRSEIAGMLAESSELIAEEWAIHDYENFEGLRLPEFADTESVAQAAHLIVEHGPVFAGLLNHFGGLGALKEAQSYMDDGYRGEFDSLGDYAAALIEDCYGDALKQLPDFIRYHIDYEGIGRDLDMGGDVFTVECDGRVHVFDAQL